MNDDIGRIFNEVSADYRAGYALAKVTGALCIIAGILAALVGGAAFVMSIAKGKEAGLFESFSVLLLGILVVAVGLASSAIIRALLDTAVSTKTLVILQVRHTAVGAPSSRPGAQTP